MPAFNGSHPTCSYQAKSTMPAMQQMDTMMSRPGMFSSRVLLYNEIVYLEGLQRDGVGSMNARYQKHGHMLFVYYVVLLAKQHPLAEIEGIL